MEKPFLANFAQKRETINQNFKMIYNEELQMNFPISNSIEDLNTILGTQTYTEVKPEAEDRDASDDYFTHLSTGTFTKVKAEQSDFDGSEV